MYAVAYATGSFGGGFATERFGRRTVLTGAAALHRDRPRLARGRARLDLFLLAGPARGAGRGALDGGMNGLILDLYPTGRGRAINLLHLFFSLGALTAPLVVGRLVEGGIAWSDLYVASGAVALLVAIGFAWSPMPDGRVAGIAAHGRRGRRLATAHSGRAWRDR